MLVVIGLLGALSVPNTTKAVYLQVNTESPYVTKAEAAMLIIASAHAQIPKQLYHNQYPDVRGDQWYTDYVLLAIQEGIIKADSTGLVEPHKPISRAEYLIMLTKAFTLPVHKPHTYVDVPAGKYFSPYAGIAQSLKLFPNTQSQDILSPEALMSHEEASYALQVVMNAYPNLRKVSYRHYYTRRRILYKNAVSLVIPRITNALHSSAPAEKKKSSFVTTNMVKQAMMSILRQDTVVADSTKKELIDAVNLERFKAGLSALTESPLLEQSARKHAEDMWKRNYFAHDTPEGNSYVDRIRSSGYFTSSYQDCGCTSSCVCEVQFAVGENIAQGQLTVQQVMRDWMDSEQHKANILQPEFTEIGIGLYGTVWVQNFGKRKFFQR